MYTYDNGNQTVDQVSDLQYSDGRVVRYDRDANGNILSVEDSAAFAGADLYTTTYDAANQVDIHLDLASGYSFDYDYFVNTHGGQASQVAMVADGLSVIQTYGYDAFGRMTSISDPEIGFISWLYTTAGRLDNVSLPVNGTEAVDYTYTTDGRSRLGQISAAGLGYSVSYGYDGNGNITNRTINSANDAITYDPVNRVTTAGSESFAYDLAGNMSAPNGWTFNVRNELTARPGYTYTYDNNGRIDTITRTATGQVITLTWNAADQLTRYQDPANTVDAHYTYDPSGRRIEKSVNGTITKYVWQGQTLIAELDGSDAIQKRYVYRGFTPLAMVDYSSGSAVPYYYLTDAIGTPLQMVDSAGTVVWSAAYKTFGEATISVSTTTQNLRYPGQYYDAESGLHYNLARYYDPGAGRYLSVDPLRDAEDYAYAGNNPYRLVDPTGAVTCGSPRECSAIFNELENPVNKYSQELIQYGPAPLPIPDYISFCVDLGFKVDGVRMLTDILSIGGCIEIARSGRIFLGGTGELSFSKDIPANMNIPNGLKGKTNPVGFSFIAGFLSTDQETDTEDFLRGFSCTDSIGAGPSIGKNVTEKLESSFELGFATPGLGRSCTESRELKLYGK